MYYTITRAILTITIPSPNPNQPSPINSRLPSTVGIALFDNEVFEEGGSWLSFDEGDVIEVSVECLCSNGMHAIKLGD